MADSEENDVDRPAGDTAFVVELIGELGNRAVGERNVGIAHPLIVDARLHEQMDEATATTELAPEGRFDGYVERAGRPLFEIQRRFNRAVVASLHQFDHRTRAQDDRIRVLEDHVARLEAELRERRDGS